jgi:hypothetical protein
MENWNSLGNWDTQSPRLRDTRAHSDAQQLRPLRARGKRGTGTDWLLVDGLCCSQHQNLGCTRRCSESTKPRSIKNASRRSWTRGVRASWTRGPHSHGNHLSGEVHSATIGYSPTSLRFRPGGETLGYDRQVAEGVDVRKGHLVKPVPQDDGGEVTACRLPPPIGLLRVGAPPIRNVAARSEAKHRVVTIQKNGRPMGEPIANKPAWCIRNISYDSCI